MFILLLYTNINIYILSTEARVNKWMNTQEVKQSLNCTNVFNVDNLNKASMKGFHLHLEPLFGILFPIFYFFFKFEHVLRSHLKSIILFMNCNIPHHWFLLIWKWIRRNCHSIKLINFETLIKNKMYEQQLYMYSNFIRWFTVQAKIVNEAIWVFGKF